MFSLHSPVFLVMFYIYSYIYSILLYNFQDKSTIIQYTSLFANSVLISPELVGLSGFSPHHVLKRLLKMWSMHWHAA